MYLGDSGGICCLGVEGRGEGCVEVVVVVLYKHLRDIDWTQREVNEAIRGGMVHSVDDQLQSNAFRGLVLRERISR